jgi:hypothetical protein
MGTKFFLPKSFYDTINNKQKRIETKREGERRGYLLVNTKRIIIKKWWVSSQHFEN